MYWATLLAIFFTRSPGHPGCARDARFFLVQCTKTGKNIPNGHYIFKMAVNRPYGHKIYQPFKIDQNWDFWFENTIWQPFAHN
jgi:hypothetical protein